MGNKAKSLFILVIVVAAILGFFWLADFLGSGEKAESEKPIVICKPQNAPPEKQECLWTAHIHATVKVFKNDKEIPIRFEQGKLEEEHTHSEQNKIHWHGLIQVSPKTKEVEDWSSLAVSTIPDSLKLSVEGIPQFLVNGKEVDPSHIWQDGDIIEIRYE